LSRSKEDLGDVTTRRKASALGDAPGVKEVAAMEDVARRAVADVSVGNGLSAAAVGAHRSLVKQRGAWTPNLKR
tara:strand:+ start:309 stop:530 length:222 start_codon:yes stop_codon:yes gene_type:complete